MRRPRVVMIDMGTMGNLGSVREGFRRIDVDVELAASPGDIERADAVVLPGVGAFGDGMASLRRQGLVHPLRYHALDAAKPLLGICLGMQLLGEGSEEHGTHEGLGLVPGHVIRLRNGAGVYRVPNMGWCDVSPARPNGRLLGGLERPTPFYFAHSYWLRCADAAHIAGTIDHVEPVTAAVEAGRILGVQFHPEKSQEAGLDVLNVFRTIVEDAC